MAADTTTAILEGTGTHKKEKAIDIFHYCLFCLIGFSSWLLVNGLFIEIPYFINELPQGYTIASQISLLIQFCNIFPLVYVAFFKYLRKIPYEIYIGVLILLAIVTCYCLAFLWSITYFDYPIYLWTLTIFSGSIGCVSVVIFYPFSSCYNPILTSAISLGGGLTGLIPSLLGIIQTESDDFTVKQFFLWLSSFLFASLLAFVVSFHPQLIGKKRDTKFTELNETITDQPSYNHIFNEDKFVMKPLGYVLIANQFSLCFIYYFLIGAVPYAVPDSIFSNGDSLLSSMYIGGMALGSIGRFLCSFSKLRFSSKPFIFICTGIQLVLGIFVFSQCVAEWITGDWIWTVVFCFILFSGLNGYQDTLLYQIAALVHQNVSHIEKLTRYIGLSNQFGAFVGSIISFLIVFYAFE